MIPDTDCKENGKNMTTFRNEIDRLNRENTAMHDELHKTKEALIQTYPNKIT